MVAIVETTTVAMASVHGDAIGARHLGMNLAQGYERFGTRPWEKFDEVQTSVGSSLVRFPGGTEAETLFDYRNPQATTVLGPDGVVYQLIAPDAFLDYTRARGAQATIVLPMDQLLDGARYGSRDFDPAMASHLRAYVAGLLDKAGPAGIATFELGNEYEGWMTSTEYGKVASAAAVIVEQELARYYAAHPGQEATRPDIAVQIWGQSAGGGLSLADLSARNLAVIAQFSPDELAAITSVTSHFYYTEGKYTGLPNVHSYGNIDTAIGYSVAMMETWSASAGRDLDRIFSEWNVQLADRNSYGVQQIPILLEMFETFLVAGVDEMDIWSTMYNGTALANYRGDLQAAGVLMSLLTREAQGMKAMDIPPLSANYDIHGFSSGSKVYLYVSSLSDGALDLGLDLRSYLEKFGLTSVRLIEPNDAASDGIYKSLTGLHPWEDPDTPVLLRTLTTEGLWSDVFHGTLGAHETLVLELTKATTKMGSAGADSMGGKSLDDRIDAMGSNDLVRGYDGNDTLLGGEGRDTLMGGEGNDVLYGGSGMDQLWGGNGDDRLEGKGYADQLFANAGNDYLSGGDAADTLTGGLGADAFVFRSGETGTDLVTDFRRAEGDFIVYHGGAAVDAGDFWLERRAVDGIGSETPEVLVHWAADDRVLAVLQDADLGAITFQDALTGLTWDLG